MSLTRVGQLNEEAEELGFDSLQLPLQLNDSHTNSLHNPSYQKYSEYVPSAARSSAEQFLSPTNPTDFDSFRYQHPVKVNQINSLGRSLTTNHCSELDFLSRVSVPYQQVEQATNENLVTDMGVTQFPFKRKLIQIGELGQTQDQLNLKTDEFHANPMKKKVAKSCNFPSFYKRMKEKPCTACGMPVTKFYVDGVSMNSRTDNQLFIPITLSEGNGCRHWTSREETFLIGIIFDMLYRRGSLAPTKAQRNVNDVCWERIKKMFDTANLRYALITRVRGGVTTCSTRTLHAIVRHFKVMKANLNEHEPESDEDSDELPLFKKLHRKWEDEFNQRKILTCSDRKFKGFIEEMHSLSNHSCLM